MSLAQQNEQQDSLFSNARERTEDTAVLSVSQWTKKIKDVLETTFSDIVIEGEISNYTHHRSGHRYWTLKDEQAQISCVFWKSRSASFEIEAGQKVICRGRLSLYAPRGTYQLDVFQIRPVGVGALQLAFEKLHRKLEAEGLFDPSRKRPIPAFPKRLGIVTSATGAAIHDILTTLRRRYPLVSVLVRPASVQGVGSELQVAQAIRELNMLPASDKPEVLIVGRGGGSLEDLWTFNEEAVARAIFASEIPVISAVGHEVDVTIADLVADLRAATPTAAAELATPDKSELLSAVTAGTTRMRYTMDAKLSEWQSSIDSHLSGYGLRYAVQKQLQDYRNLLERSSSVLSSSIDHKIELSRLMIQTASGRLKAMDPNGILKRGFGFVASASGAVVTSINQVGEEPLRLTLSDGTVLIKRAS